MKKNSKNNSLFSFKDPKFFKRKKSKPAIDQKTARKIMTSNFFGIEEAKKCFGIEPSTQQTASLLQIPFSKEFLKEKKDTHVLTAVFPLSIIKIENRVSSRLFSDYLWYDNGLFDQKNKPASWWLISKTPKHSSVLKTWEEQKKTLKRGEKVPTARIISYMVIGYYLNTGQYLFKDTYVRTSSEFKKEHIIVGCFNSYGLKIRPYSDYNESYCVGISCAWSV